MIISYAGQEFNDRTETTFYRFMINELNDDELQEMKKWLRDNNITSLKDYKTWKALRHGCYIIWFSDPDVAALFRLTYQ